MSICVICLRPVVMEPSRLDTGELCHVRCRHLPPIERPRRLDRRAARQVDDFVQALLKRTPS
jgi:hypothetical protein